MWSFVLITVNLNSEYLLLTGDIACFQRMPCRSGMIKAVISCRSVMLEWMVVHCYSFPLTISSLSTGGVVTLDPCGHLCSLDGVQVTVPTPLTQGKLYTHICAQCRSACSQEKPVYCTLVSAYIRIQAFSHTHTLRYCHLLVLISTGVNWKLTSLLTVDT